MNSMFLKLPTEATITARMTFIRLNKVKVFFAMIFQVELWFMG